MPEVELIMTPIFGEIPAAIAGKFSRQAKLTAIPVAEEKVTLPGGKTRWETVPTEWWMEFERAVMCWLGYTWRKGKWYVDERKEADFNNLAATEARQRIADMTEQMQIKPEGAPL